MSESEPRTGDDTIYILSSHEFATSLNSLLIAFCESNDSTCPISSGKYLYVDVDIPFIPPWRRQDNWRELRKLYVGFRGHGRSIKPWLTRRGNSFADRRVNKWKSFNARLKRKYG